MTFHGVGMDIFWNHTICGNVRGSGQKLGSYAIFGPPVSNHPIIGDWSSIVPSLYGRWGGVVGDQNKTLGCWYILSWRFFKSLANHPMMVSFQDLQSAAYYLPSSVENATYWTNFIVNKKPIKADQLFTQLKYFLVNNFPPFLKTFPLLQ